MTAYHQRSLQRLVSSLDRHLDEWKLPLSVSSSIEITTSTRFTAQLTDSTATGLPVWVRQIGTQALLSVGDHRPDRFALMHEVEPFVDPIERQDVGDQIVDIDLAVHVPVDDLGHIGATARATEGRALPYPARYQLERPG